MKKLLGILLIIAFSLAACEQRYTDKTPPECQAHEGDIVIDTFSKDTLRVERLWLEINATIYSGDIIARTKAGQMLHLDCGEYRIINKYGES